MWNFAMFPLKEVIVLIALASGALCFGVALRTEENDVAWRAAELWEDLPGESSMSFYLFNVTNPEEFLESPKTVKPLLEEIGPYVYKIQPRKAEASQQFDDGSIKFRQQKFFEFDPIASGSRSEMDEFNIVNAQLLIYGTRFVKKESGWAYQANKDIERLVNEGEVMIRRNIVKDILFNGMESSIYVEYEKYLDEYLDFPPTPPGFEAFEDGRYSYFKNKNGSDFGELHLYSSPATSYGQIITLDRSDSVSYWNDSKCDKIEGTSDGTRFQPSSSSSTGSSMLFVYLPELCRAVMLNRDDQFTGAEYDNSGVQATKYILGDSFLNYSMEHECWCADEGKDCLRDGALDIQSCALGAPYAISQPRFRNADSIYTDSVDWMSNRGRGVDDEPSYWIVEPVTGTVLEYKRRFQLNIRIGAKYGYRTWYLKEFPEFLFPIVWMEETYKLDEQSIKSLKSALEPEQPSTTTTTSTTEVPPTASTTTVKPVDQNPFSTAQFHQLQDDILRLGQLMLFATVVIIIMLIVLIVIGVLPIGGSQRRPRARASGGRVLSEPPAYGDTQFSQGPVECVTKS